MTTPTNVGRRDLPTAGRSQRGAQVSPRATSQASISAQLAVRVVGDDSCVIAPAMRLAPVPHGGGDAFLGQSSGAAMLRR
jgi:hypothetical protein